MQEPILTFSYTSFVKKQIIKYHQVMTNIAFFLLTETLHLYLRIFCINDKLRLISHLDFCFYSFTFNFNWNLFLCSSLRPWFCRDSNFCRLMGNFCFAPTGSSCDFEYKCGGGEYQLELNLHQQPPTHALVYFALSSVLDSTSC